MNTKDKEILQKHFGITNLADTLNLPIVKFKKNHVQYKYKKLPLGKEGKTQQQFKNDNDPYVVIHRYTKGLPVNTNQSQAQYLDVSNVNPLSHHENIQKLKLEIDEKRKNLEKRKYEINENSKNNQTTNKGTSNQSEKTNQTSQNQTNDGPTKSNS